MEYIKTPSDLPKKYKIKFCEKLTSMSMDFLETWLVFKQNYFIDVIGPKVHHIWSGVEKETPKKLLSVGIPSEYIGGGELAFAPLIRTSVHSPLKVQWTKVTEVELEKNLAESAEEMMYNEMAKKFKPEIEKALKETFS